MSDKKTNNQLTPPAGLYTKAFEDSVKEPIEYLQFLVWIKELIRITESQNKSLDLLYFDLFYIRIYGLFDILSCKNSVSVQEDSYTIHVKKCVAEMYSVITDDEYINLVYNRHCAAHPLQGYYDIFDPLGQKKDKKKTIIIRGQAKQLSVEDIDRVIHGLFCYHYNNNLYFEKTILQKLTPFIEKLREGWVDRANAQLKLLKLDKDSTPYKDLMTF